VGSSTRRYEASAWYLSMATQLIVAQVILIAFDDMTSVISQPRCWA
jgi:hypothetical protein